MLEKMHGTSFDFSIWKGGSLIDLGVMQRENTILQNKAIIERYAIGYCAGDEVLCRPKRNAVAVMFNKDDLLFWTHLTDYEFKNIFQVNGEREQ